jgi:mono/diheme cytochrome c family protein
MKRILVVGVAMAFTIAVGTTLAEAAGDPVKGKASFAQMCAACHGPNGKGDGPAAASLNPKPRDLSDKGYVAGLKDDYLKKLIKEGAAASRPHAPLGAP